MSEAYDADWRAKMRDRIKTAERELADEVRRRDADEDRYVTDVAQWQKLAGRLERERDEALATIERVRKLLLSWQIVTEPYMDRAKDELAALEGVKR